MSARMAIFVGRGVSLPADIALSLIPSLPRPHLERLVQRLVDHLDDEDGDPDREDDDPAGQCDEDGINTAFDCLRYQEGRRGAGCIISDPDRAADDDGEEEPPEPDTAHPMGVQ